MTTDPNRKLEVLSNKLNETILSAAQCAREIATLVHETNTNVGRADKGGPRNSHPNRLPASGPYLDEATLSVVWKGKSLHLGHTQGYWLLARLTRSVNRYVTHLDLLQDIWDDVLIDTAVLRAGVRRLRTKLRRGGMGDLADAIIGYRGRYMLSLAGSPRHREVTETAP